jgi:kynurenine formamidase
MSEHAGTHMDAPSHFIEEGEAHYGIDDVPLKQVYGRAACIDVAGVSQCNLAQRTIEDWERDNGSLENGDIVLFRYGWDQLWYMRPDGNNIAKNWPGLEEDAVDYLLKKGIKAVGCDTPSVDAFSSATFPVHYALLENEIVIIENLNNLDKLPNFSLLMAFPLKIGLGTGSPVRAVAFVSRASPVEQKRHKK